MQNLSGEGVWTAYVNGTKVGIQSVSGSGTVNFNSGFQNVDLVRWESPVGGTYNNYIDNLVFTA